MSEPRPATRMPVPAMLADTDQLFREAREGSAAFCSATPFPHLLLPSLIKPVCHTALFEGFRQEAQPEAAARPAAGRLYTQQEWPAVIRHLVWELSSATLLRHFASLTGTAPLLPDPFLVHGGVRRMSAPVTVHTAEQEYVWRHPETGLQNTLRLELFASNEKTSTVQIELLDANANVAQTLAAGNGSGLFVTSDRYHLRYRCERPEHWYSFVAWFYVNDRARPSTGERQHGY